MRVLVTGGAGYIGSHTVKSLTSQGHRPTVLDNLSTGHRWAVQSAEFVQGDIADEAVLTSTIRRYGIDAVIHFAAYAYVGESVSAPEKYYENNVIGTLRLLNVMRKLQIRNLVFSSTCATYGIPLDIPISEDHPQEPISPYGDTKLAVEKAIRAYGEAYGLRWVVLRYFNAAGADPAGDLGEEHDPETHLIPLAIKAALGELPALSVYGTDYPTPDGTAVRDYIHVADLADAHCRAVEYLDQNGEPIAINLGTGKGTSVREVIETVERVSDRKVPSVNRPRRQGDPSVLTAASHRAQQILGWTPTYTDLDSIISTAWKWHSSRERTMLTAVER